MEETEPEDREERKRRKQLWGGFQVPGRVGSVLLTARPVHHRLPRPPEASAGPGSRLPELTFVKHKWRQAQHRQTKGQDFTFHWPHRTQSRGESSQLLGI